MTPVLVVVTQDIVDAIKASVSLRDQPVIREWLDGAQRELENARRREFFVEKKVHYEEDGDCLWA